MAAQELSRVAWRKSRQSNGAGNCVEVAAVDRRVAVRDSKDRTGPVLAFHRSTWAAFIAGVRAGRLDL